VRRATGELDVRLGARRESAANRATDEESSNVQLARLERSRTSKRPNALAFPSRSLAPSEVRTLDFFPNSRGAIPWNAKRPGDRRRAAPSLLVAFDYGCQVTDSPFVKLNVFAVQKAAELRYHTWYVRTPPPTGTKPLTETVASPPCG
jgi:hypothetical protein